MVVPRVLIVDDEVGLLNLFAGLVERLQFDTIRAHGGQEALEVLACTVPDLMVLDLAMPDVSGIDILRQIQSQPQLDPMKVIVLTALGFTPDMEQVEHRVCLWLSRPIMPYDFMNAVRSVIEGPG